jgi:hypothetical protein
VTNANTTDLLPAKLYIRVAVQRHGSTYPSLSTPTCNQYAPHVLAWLEWLATFTNFNTYWLFTGKLRNLLDYHRYWTANQVARIKLVGLGFNRF